jgi:CheY-like chemotaxis protein
MRETPNVLAIEPDPERAHALAHFIHEYLDANVVVSASADVALAVMTRRMPELILLSALTPPGDERTLVAFLRQTAQACVPVLMVPPIYEPHLKRSVVSSSRRWVSRHRRPAGAESMRDALGARMRGALEESLGQWEGSARSSFIAFPDGLHAPEDENLRVPRARRWAAQDGSPLSSVRLPSGFVGDLVNISSSGLLLESNSALMPGSSVTFEFADPNMDLIRLWRPDTDLAVPGHVVRSEVSKVGPDRFRYRVAARFFRELELMSECPIDQGTSPADAEAEATPNGGDPVERSTAERLHDLARALEGLESAIARICPPTENEETSALTH